MSWFKVDDKLYSHPKWLATSKSARALWVTAGSWASDQETDGIIPRHVLVTLGGRTTEAAALVAAGLWEPCTQGWMFHNWPEFQPDAASERIRKDASRKVMSEAGEVGNHLRWHKGRGIVVPTCSHCVPDAIPDGVPDRVPESPASRVLSPRPVPVPISTSSEADEVRVEVSDLLDHLDSCITRNGAKKPGRTKGNTDAMRLLLDADHHPPEQVCRVIDWATGDSFWKANILSAVKLRQKYDQLLIKSGASAAWHPRADFPEDLIG